MKILKYLLALVMAVVVSGTLTSGAYAEVNAVTPSTNDQNRDNGWAHVNQLSQDVGETELEFVSTRGFASCFEYRSDGDTSQAKGDPNYNSNVTDGLYPFFCVNNSTRVETLTADEYVEIRMVFGAESDERFDWTRFDVLQPPFERSAEITSPTAGAEVSGVVNFTATLIDEDKDDSVQWAVRQGTCAANTGTVFGNVDGFSSPFTWDYENFAASADVSSWTPGEYCFVFNPSESPGDTAIRETRTFTVAEPLVGPPTSAKQCVNDGWQTFNNPSFSSQKECVMYVKDNRPVQPKVEYTLLGGGQLREGKDKVSFGGNIKQYTDDTLKGEWNVFFNNLENYPKKSGFHATELVSANWFEPDSATCTAAMNVTMMGKFNNEDGWKMIFRAGDDDDTARVELYDPSNVKVYDTHGDMPDESSCVGNSRTGVDAGQLKIKMS